MRFKSILKTIKASQTEIKGDFGLHARHKRSYIEDRLHNFPPVENSFPVN